MSNEKTRQPQSPGEMAEAAQQAAMKVAMKQAQAMYGNMPGFQMPDLAESQEWLMKDAATIPSVAEVQAYQTEMIKQAGMNPETMQKAYQQNLDFAQQMMQQAMGGIASENEDKEDYLNLGTDADWEITRKGDGKLTPEQSHYLAFGAPICVYNGDYVDSIESTTDTDTLKDILKEWWEVTDKKTALETIDWLLNEGQHVDADPVLAEILKRGMDDISEEEKADEESKMGDVYTIAEFILEMNDVSIDALPETVLGWDLVRAVNVARWAFLCGYMSENEMWDTVQVTVDIAKETFHSWEEYGLSFAVGRGVWQGNTEDYETADEVISALLRKDESPWKQTEW